MKNTILKHMNLVGAFNTSENMSSSVGMIVPFPMENKKNMVPVTTNQE
jgi:hypothetical protein